VTEVALTMLDVLAGFDEIRVCTGYSGADGSRTDRFMADAFELSRVTPTYTTFEGFSEDIGGARRIGDLPANARRYVEFIEASIGVSASMIGVGPDREQTIYRT